MARRLQAGSRAGDAQGTAGRAGSCHEGCLRLARYATEAVTSALYGPPLDGALLVFQETIRRIQPGKLAASGGWR